MPIIDPDEFDIVEQPELVIGLVAAVGTPLDYVCSVVAELLEKRHYDTEVIRFSELLSSVTLSTPVASGASRYERLMSLMDRGNELRRIAGGGEVLALMAAAQINHRRPHPQTSAEQVPPHLEGKAFLLRQLKHPDEVLWLRKIYGNAFHLVGVYSSEAVRRENLVVHEGVQPHEADELIARDQGEQQSYGQQLRDTYYRSDVFVSMNGHGKDAAAQLEKQLDRYFKLLFGELDAGILSPTLDEYGMHLASTAALRSSDLSRQVGAAIIAEGGEVLSLGTNEVPAAGGGQYWPHHEHPTRDCDVGYDSNARETRKILHEILETLDPSFSELDPREQDGRVAEVADLLQQKRIMNLTEFGRSVHAEMEAILAAGRAGTSVRRSTLYTTTFPCHNCAKHIVGAGIARVVYVEPYPKSLAEDLHADAISMSDGAGEKVRFEPFVGVAPRKYQPLFSILGPEGKRVRRKNPDGTVRRDGLGFRLKADLLTYIERESAAALAAREIGQIPALEDTSSEQDEDASE